MRKKVLFLCTGNSCRSQMAEGWTRHFFGDEVEAYSAGIEAHGLNPRAVAVMKEMGVDISGQRSQVVGEFAEIEFDLVLTVCGHAHENCPLYLGKGRVIYHGFEDPAQATGDELETMKVFRRVAQEVRDFVQKDLGQYLQE